MSSSLDGTSARICDTTREQNYSAMTLYIYFINFIYLFIFIYLFTIVTFFLDINNPVDEV